MPEELDLQNRSEGSVKNEIQHYKMEESGNIFLQSTTFRGGPNQRLMVDKACPPTPTSPPPIVPIGCTFNHITNVFVQSAGTSPPALSPQKAVLSSQEELQKLKTMVEETAAKVLELQQQLLESQQRELAS